MRRWWNDLSPEQQVALVKAGVAVGASLTWFAYVSLKKQDAKAPNSFLVTMLEDIIEPKPTNFIEAILQPHRPSYFDPYRY